MDFFDRSDIEDSIRRIDKIMASGIFHVENSGNVLFRAAFIEVLIALRDLMYKSEKYASRIAFTDDVMITDKVSDVSSLIKYVRDALCHPDSDNHYLENGKFKASFNVCFGQGTVLRVGDFEQTNPYAEEICFFFGAQRILLRRHVLRAFEEAKTKLLPLLRSAHG